MLDILLAVEKELPGLLQDESIWRSVYVDYHPPVVERLWLRWREFRIYLHRIHPCSAGQALFHPHPWPSAMRILSGTYEMAVGYGKGETLPPVAALMQAEGNFRYEMTDPDAWHYVRPVGEPTLSLMVTGKPWDRWAPKSDKTLSPLKYEQAKELFHLFRDHYWRYRLLAPDGSTYRSAEPGTLGGNSKDRIYGQLNCGSATAAIRKGGYVPFRVFFADEAAAVAAGYRPCGNCMRALYNKWNLGGVPGSVDYPWLVTPKR
jgi:hypothetical protein